MIQKEKQLSHIDQTEQNLLAELGKTGGMTLNDAIDYVEKITNGKNFGVELDITDIIRRHIELKTVEYDEEKDIFFLTSSGTARYLQ